MFHREIYAALSVFFKERRSTGRNSFLDAGCGDARFIPALLEAGGFRHYTGLDLSAVSLELAAQNLTALEARGLSIRLLQMDMLSGLEAITETFDTVFSSFALHHLTHEDKQEFFKRCFSVLNPGGLLVVVDTLRTETESREQYMDAIRIYAQNNWHCLEDAETEAALEHITTQDFPESFAALQVMADSAGFPELRQLICRDVWFQCVYTCKPPLKVDAVTA
ncbi:class I SAM-dependent methyltransferase [Candidatus Methylospira mobilis]|nr:class I SAM-dependent methyltransferase [Candidatus Methylospira mobilis]WNV05205.1 class I SAM-dependent methyltransferase [Candidatus Methylospira mobilis]